MPYRQTARWLSMTALALALAAPAVTHAQQQGRAQQDGPYATGTQRVAPRGAVSARLLSAGQLLDKPVVSDRGEKIGSVDHIVINPETGFVTALLVGTATLDRTMPELDARGQIRGGQQQAQGRQGTGRQGQGQGPGQGQGRQDRGGQQQAGNGLIALPWHSVDVTLGAPGEVVFPAPIALARQQPRIGEAQIARVTSPRFAARMVEFHVPAGGQQGMDRTRRNGPQQQARQGRGGGGQPQMLVTQGIVGMIAPPAVTTADQMQGLSVSSTDGEYVGDIELVMIDADRGRVDYVLVNQSPDTQGADLLVPIAYGDLDLAADGMSFVLDPQAVVVGIAGIGLDEAEGGRRPSRMAGTTAGGYGREAYGGR